MLEGLEEGFEDLVAEDGPDHGDGETFSIAGIDGLVIEWDEGGGRRRRARKAEGTDGGDIKEGVEGGEPGEEGLDGYGGTEVGMEEAEELFLFFEDVFDVESRDIILEEETVREVRAIRGDEVSGLAVEEFASFGEAIFEGMNDDEANGDPAANDFPTEVIDDLIAEGAFFASNNDGGFMVGNGIVFAEFVGCRSFFAIEAASALFALLGWRIEQTGVFANATDVRDGRADGRDSHKGFKEIL